MIKKLRIIIILITLVSFASHTIAQEGIDDQVTSIANQLMCPVCQGQSVGESNSNLAHDMRDIVRKQLQEGKTQEEILAYFVSSYGESILAAPPPKGFNWFLWLLPGVAIIVGGVGITMFLFRAQKEDKNELVENNKDIDSSQDEYLKKVREDIDSDDT